MEIILCDGNETGYYLYKLLKKYKAEYFMYDCITDDRVIAEVKNKAIDCRKIYRKHTYLDYKPNKIYRIEDNVYRTIGRIGEYNDFRIEQVDTTRCWTVIMYYHDDSNYAKVVYLDKSDKAKNFYTIVEDSNGY